MEGILDVRELRAEYVGPGVVHAGLHLVVSPDVSVEKAHRMAETVRHRVHKETDGHCCLIQVEPPTRGPAVRLMTNRLKFDALIFRKVFVSCQGYRSLDSTQEHC